MKTNFESPSVFTSVLTLIFVSPLFWKSPRMRNYIASFPEPFQSELGWGGAIEGRALNRLAKCSTTDILCHQVCALY